MNLWTRFICTDIVKATAKLLYVCIEISANVDYRKGFSRVFETHRKQNNCWLADKRFGKIVK